MISSEITDTKSEDSKTLDHDSKVDDDDSDVADWDDEDFELPDIEPSKISSSTTLTANNHRDDNIYWLQQNSPKKDKVKLNDDKDASELLLGKLFQVLTTAPISSKRTLRHVHAAH